jgi:hypothetical protein
MDQAHDPWTKMQAGPRWTTTMGNGQSSLELRPDGGSVSQTSPREFLEREGIVAMPTIGTKWWWVLEIRPAM